MILISHIKRTVQVLVYVALCAALALALGLCGACLALAKPNPEPMRGLSQAEQRAAAMIIFVECPSGSQWFGSGVVVSPDHVVTAAHVVACADPPRIVLVGEALTVMRKARVDRYSIDSDLARLRVDFPFENVRPAAEIGSATAGAAICIATAYPERRWSCGVVQERDSSTRHDLDHTAPTIHGNSGSGIYDSRGQLVGIATQCYTATLPSGETDCSRDGGRATALDLRQWVMP